MTLRLTVLRLAVLGSLVMSGCAVAAGDGADGPSTDSSRTAAGTPAPASSAAPSPEEISAGVLEQAQQAAARPAAASVTGAVDGEPITLDLVAVTRTDDATLAEFRLSTTADELLLGLTTFESSRFGSLNFVTGVQLDDTVNGVRYRPLSWTDGRSACACPYKPLTLGPRPQPLFALFPELPTEVFTVSFGLGDGSLTVTGVAVQP